MMRRSALVVMAWLPLTACTPAAIQSVNERDAQLTVAAPIDRIGQANPTQEAPLTEQEGTPGGKPEVAIKQDDDLVVVAEVKRDDGRPYQDNEITIAIAQVADKKAVVTGDAALHDSIAVEQPVVVSVTENATGKVVASQVVMPPPAEPEIEVNVAAKQILVTSAAADLQVSMAVLTKDGEVETVSSNDGTITVQSLGNDLYAVGVDPEVKPLDIEVVAKASDGKESEPVGAVVALQVSDAPAPVVAKDEALKTQSEALKVLRKKRKELKKERNKLQKDLEEMKVAYKQAQHDFQEQKKNDKADNKGKDKDDKSKLSKKDKDDEKAEQALEQMLRKIDVSQAQLSELHDQLKDLKGQIKEAQAAYKTMRKEWLQVQQKAS